MTSKYSFCKSWDLFVRKKNEDGTYFFSVSFPFIKKEKNLQIFLFYLVFAILGLILLEGNCDENKLNKGWKNSRGSFSSAGQLLF